jgi:hypothetical protein
MGQRTWLQHADEGLAAHADGRVFISVPSARGTPPPPLKKKFVRVRNVDRQKLLCSGIEPESVAWKATILAIILTQPIIYSVAGTALIPS